MAFAQLAEELTSACEDELGDIATLTDGAITLDGVVGFFSRDFSEYQSQVYGLTQPENTWECRASLFASLDLSGIGTSLKVIFNGRAYVVMDIRYAVQINALLILSR